MTANTKFASILFAADHPDLGGQCYDSPCEQALLDTLITLGNSVTYPIRVLRGDLIPHVLATRLKHIQIPVKDATKKSFSYKQERDINMRAFATIVGDLSDSLKDGLATVDLVKFPGLFGNSNIFCLTLSPMSLEGIKAIDSQLQSFGPYLGAVVLDKGNPLHISLFSEFLLDCVWIDNGVINLSRWYTDEGTYEFGLNPTKNWKIVEVPYLDFQQKAPPRPKVEAVSSRGALSADRLVATTTPTHLEQVANRLSTDAINSTSQFPVDLKIVLPADEQMYIPISKLIDYALSEEHPKGKHKAKLFMDLMAISKNEWRFLAYQIRNGLERARLEKIEITEHGIQYGAQMEVIGLNNHVMTVETRWIIRDNEPAQLSTVFIASINKQQNQNLAPLPWVPLSTTGDARWSMIYELANKAGIEAAKLHVPTPMQVSGFEVNMDGACGSSYLTLDGRSAFGRWLKKSGHSSTSYSSGIMIGANTRCQSMERAKAYSEAFARILWLNGIDGAKVHSYLS